MQIPMYVIVRDEVDPTHFMARRQRELTLHLPSS
jgi:hypothetical protein